MWEVGSQQPVPLDNVNEEMLTKKGYLEEKDAKLLLYRFFKENISFATKILMGVDLFPFQHMMVKAMMQVDYFLGIISRGGSKSYSTAVFIGLYAMMHQGVHIGVVSASFRQSKAIAKKLEDIAKTPQGRFLARYMKISKAPDQWEIDIGLSKITILPLGSGEKLRGFRFQVMVIDELLLFPQKILSEVILPFLAVVTNPQERDKIKKAEDALIKQGKMQESERKIWPANKIIGLSSASYQFEFLYTYYKQYEKAIMSGSQKDGRHAIFHIAYSALPPALYDAALIAKSKEEMSFSQYQREYEAVFTSDSSGFFKVSKMMECTIPDGEGQTVEVIGESGCSYICSLDPSWSESDSSDDFAIQILKLDPNKNCPTLVHSYAVSGAGLKNHIAYFHYVLTRFNIVMIAGDYNGGVQFLTSCNESEVFKQSNLKIETIDANFDDQTVYNQSISEIRSQYNLTSKKICILKSPSSEWIRIANEGLQDSIEFKKIWFAGKAIDDAFEVQIKTKIPLDEFKFSRFDKIGADSDSKKTGIHPRMVEFVENLKENIELTKIQCALIEPSVSSYGTMSFDLPANLKKQRGSNKSRKDLYSALLLGVWGARVYSDMISKPVDAESEAFVPCIF